MTFDPFGDFAVRGYLRNHAAQKDPAKIKDLEHDSFRANVGRALQYLSQSDMLTFDDVKAVHKTLFEDVYPWAGQDRSQNALEIHVTKGNVEFMFANHVGRGVEYALQQGNDVSSMRVRPGEVMGHLAYAHPFLDGNGRTIMTVHSELCRRAGIHIDWGKTEKNAYLEALTAEIDAPGKGYLDAYLKPFMLEGALQLVAISANLQQLPGLGPQAMVGDSVQREIMVPSATLSPEVSRQELQDRLAASKAVQTSTAKLEKQVGIVFSNPKPVLAAIREVAETGKLDDLSIVGELSQISGLAGKSGVLVARQDRLSRQNAIEGQHGLRSLVGTHINVVHGIRKTMAQERQAVVDKARVEVRAPSQSLTQAIQESRPLSEAHKSELRKVMTTLEERFGSDLGEIRAGVKPERLEELSRKHGLDPKQVERVESTLKVLDKGQIRVRQEARKLEQAKAAEQGRGGPVR